MQRTVVSGAIGNALEWYDFAVFGFFAPFISTQFFPSDDELAGLINTFGVFAAGYLVRPIGGVLFGRLGDRKGREPALRLSIVAMAVPTSLIAVLPTHAEAGVMAAVLLVALRLIQGISVGGEFIGSVCYLVEVAPAKHRGLYGSFAVMTAVGGMLLGSAVATLLHGLLTADQLEAWGWRLPFLGGIVIGTFGWWLRRTLQETPSFLDLAASGGIERQPLTAALREMPGRVIKLGALVALLGVAIYTLFIWMPTYLTHIVQPAVPHALLVNTCAMGLLIALMPLAGALADKVSAKSVLLLAALLTALSAYPLFAWIDGGTLLALIVAQVIFAVINGAVQGPIPVAMVDLFPARLRYSAIAVGYNISLALFGGTAPLVATWLIHRTGDLTAPTMYLLVTAVISGIATWRLAAQREPIGRA
jgi:MHS family proline/betaine transporter-like MFS transporter